jgi:hypothetical protein
MKRSLKKYLNPANYGRRLLTIVNRMLLHHLDWVVAPACDTPLRHPPIFILGAPRCGSTLLFQVLTDAFDVGYISNAHCRFFGAPALAERVLRPLANKPMSDYTSQHGMTKGRYGPAECGEWWYRFFRRTPAYVPLADADPEKMRCFRRSLLAMVSAFEKPVFFKNLYASLRLEPISKIVPEALFIVVRRDLVDNARSLLASRLLQTGGYETWFSVPPPDIDLLRQLPVAQQVVGQVRSIYRTIERGMEHIGSDRFLVLQYERFCDDVHGTLKEVESFLDRWGVTLIRAGIVPTHFSRPDQAPIPDSIARDLREYAEAVTAG